MRQKLVSLASVMLPRAQSDVFDGTRERGVSVWWKLPDPDFGGGTQVILCHCFFKQHL